MLRLWFAFWFFGSTLPLLAPPLPNEAVVAQLYARALAGDEQAVVECIAVLEQALRALPNDQLARVYLGSATTLRSRDLPFFGSAKLAALRRGIALMDEAAAAAPHDARVQLLRAVTNEAFPAILGRRQLARKALDDLVAAVEREPGKLKPSDRQLLYLNAGEAAEKAGDHAHAVTLWRRGLEINGEGKLRQEIREALAHIQSATLERSALSERV